jgi:hypothetical protein
LNEQLFSQARNQTRDQSGQDWLFCLVLYVLTS